MSKKPLVDESAKTLAEMYGEHFSRFNMVESNKGQASPDLVQRTYHSAAKGFKKDLACGEDKAAPLIAYLQGNGFGCNENPLKAAEWVAIGAELGNEDCKKLTKDIDPEHYSGRMKSLCIALRKHGTSTEQIFSHGVIFSGSQHAEAIRENIAKYKTDTAILDVKSVNNCIKNFEHSSSGLYVYNESSYSFPDKDDGCHCLGCVVM